MAPPLERGLLLANVVFLAATVPLSLIAYRGFRGTPWGRVIRWFPAVALGYLVTQSLILLDVQGPLPFLVGLAGVVVGVAATTLNSVRLALLLSGGREV